MLDTKASAERFFLARNVIFDIFFLVIFKNQPVKKKKNDQLQNLKRIYLVADLNIL